MFKLKKIHFYLNPEEIREASQRYNISNEMVKDKPKFRKSTKIFGFIKGDSLVIHNAEFDLKFLNYELNKIGGYTNEIIDTPKLQDQNIPDLLFL